MTQFSKMRVHGAPLKFHHAKRATSCATGGLYTSPAAGQTVSSDDSFNITWDPTCIDTTAVDIYLYAPEAPTPRIHLWETVDFQAGSYQTSIKPRWWNASSSVHLQLRIVEAGQPPFLTSLPAGPVFTATYAAPASGSVPANADTSIVESGVELVNNLPQTKSGLDKGKVAAAVLVPLLVIIALIIGAYIRIKRQKGKEERKKWTEAVDQRMSRMSMDWKSVTPAGAAAAIRASMAGGEAGNRSSSFSFGQIRPSSTVADGGHAGIGARGMQSQGIDQTTPQMSQLQSGPRINTTSGERVSRVSFAADPRPSVDSRRSQYNSRSSRAFHVGHVPPVPVRQDSDLMSPTQASGPLSLTADDIKARMAGSDTPARPSVDEMMPALSMMRMGLVNNDDMLLPQHTPSPELAMPSPPLPTHQTPKASIVGIMPMQPMPANVMSPDEMLRAYAERRGVASPPPTPGAPAMPAPVVNYNGNGMRTLYSPTTPESPQSAYRKSLAPTEHSKYEDDDAYVGTAA